jgi:hypothetical protein
MYMQYAAKDGHIILLGKEVDVQMFAVKVAEALGLSMDTELMEIGLQRRTKPTSGMDW